MESPSSSRRCASIRDMRGGGPGWPPSGSWPPPTSRTTLSPRSRPRTGPPIVPSSSILLLPSLTRSWELVSSSQRRFLEAAAAYRRALELDPDDITTNFWFATDLIEEGYVPAREQAPGQGPRSGPDVPERAELAQLDRPRRGRPRSRRAAEHAGPRRRPGVRGHHGVLHRRAARPAAGGGGAVDRGLHQQSGPTISRCTERDDCPRRAGRCPGPRPGGGPDRPLSRKPLLRW